MKEETRDFLDESIRLELNISELYQLFSVKLPHDAEFWRIISMEEVNHAALIRTINEQFLTEKILPHGTIAEHTELIRRHNVLIKNRIEEFREIVPSRETAFNLAFELETSVGEIHYQRLMTNRSESVVDKVFQMLNGEDKNHARRILNYMKRNLISHRTGDNQID